MTVLRKSDAQLDAEAAARRNPPPTSVRPTADPDPSYSPMGLRPPMLDCGQLNHGVRKAPDQYGTLHEQWCCLAAEARREWYLAMPEGIHVHAVPTDTERIPLARDADGKPTRYAQVFDAGELGGPPFRPAFVTFLDHPRDPLFKAVKNYREQICASRHGTWPDHRGRAVCGSLLHSVIGLGMSLDMAADLLDLTPERAANHLTNALQTIWNWRAQELNDEVRPSRKARSA